MAKPRSWAQLKRDYGTNIWAVWFGKNGHNTLVDSGQIDCPIDKLLEAFFGSHYGQDSTLFLWIDSDGKFHRHTAS